MCATQSYLSMIYKCIDFKKLGDHWNRRVTFKGKGMSSNNFSVFCKGGTCNCLLRIGCWLRGPESHYLSLFSKWHELQPTWIWGSWHLWSHWNYPIPLGAKPFAMESKARAAGSDLRRGLERGRGRATAQGAQGEQKSSKINPLQIIFISPWDKSHPWQSWFNSSSRQEGSSLRTRENVLFPFPPRVPSGPLLTLGGEPGGQKGISRVHFTPEYFPRENAPPLPGREKTGVPKSIWSNIIAGRRKSWAA